MRSFRRYVPIQPVFATNQNLVIFGGASEEEAGAFAKVDQAFAEYRFFYRALLQKRPMILRSLLIVATRGGGRSLR